MSIIYSLVHRTLEVGYLSTEAERELQVLVSNGCDIHDMDAVVVLKQAMAFGHVKRQSRINRAQTARQAA